MAERLLGSARERLPKGLRWGLTVLFVNLGWVFFWAPSLADAGALLSAAFTGGGGWMADSYVSYALNRIFDNAIGVVAALVVNSMFPGGFTFCWMKGMIGRVVHGIHKLLNN